MSWQEYRARAKIIEQNFAKNLKDPNLIINAYLFINLRFFVE